jgi:hypothetical protein
MLSNPVVTMMVSDPVFNPVFTRDGGRHEPGAGPVQQGRGRSGKGAEPRLITQAGPGRVRSRAHGDAPPGSGASPASVGLPRVKKVMPYINFPLTVQAAHGLQNKPVAWFTNSPPFHAMGRGNGCQGFAH